ncbi:MAG: N-acetylneuraminate synthase family protein [Patescibacteria group bacterium]
MGPQIEIRHHKIGEGNPCFIIAEACVNHLGRFDLAKDLVTRSKEAGADAIKFQYHIPDSEMLPGIKMSDNFDEPLYEFLKKNALTFEQHGELKQFAEEVGITYLCTPFSTQAALQLDEIGLEAFKIGSGEMTDLLSLERIAELGKPMMVSTGMSTIEEIDRTYDALIKKNIGLALFNCVSEYPPNYEDMNLDFITIMRQRYPKAVIGHSDHTPDDVTSYAAVVLGAHMIEKHVILDKAHKSCDQMVSLDFVEFKELVDGIRKIEAARGVDRKVHGREEQIRSWAFHYAVSEKGLKAGQVIKEEMIMPGDIWTKRTGHADGIKSHEVPKLIGAKVLKDIPPNSPLFWEQFEVTCDRIETPSAV